MNGNVVKYGTTAFFAAVMFYLVPELREDEGRSLVAYKDPVGVWTICDGSTKGVKPGMKVTDDFCDELTEQEAQAFALWVYSKLQVPLSVETFRSHARFAYNIGPNGYARSKTLRLTNKGDIAGGCGAMMNWYTAGGRDCRQKANNCYGLILRREREKQLCLKGI